MSDDKANQLANLRQWGLRWAADRIEALEAERDAAVLALKDVGSPDFIRPIVEEQSCGEWGGDIVDADTAKICAAIRARSNKEPGQ